MRTTGVLHAISSLPNRYGIGDFGREAYQFVDLLVESHVHIWQILPLNPLGYGNSPYQPYSSSALDELYISLELLQKEGLLPRDLTTFNRRSTRVDYDAVRQYKMPLLQKAFAKFTRQKRKGLKSFIRANKWVYNYAVFRALKQANQMRLWTEWPAEHKNWINDHQLDLTPYANDIAFHMWLQYMAIKQWQKLHKYANRKAIKIMGDIPLYVGIDSDDVWGNQSEFLLDKNGNPAFIAGVPPDYFSLEGQRWGNPIYDWDKMAKNDYHFWIRRLAFNAELFDIIRIDHFRGFDTYWKVPASCPTAIEGEWVLGPAHKFFDVVFAKLPQIHIVAEDLGDLRPEVLELRDHYKFKGMNIVQFSFDPTSNKPKTDRANSIIYTGTHDNETLLGWIKNLPPAKAQAAGRHLVLALGYDQNESLVDKFLRYTLENIAEWAIIPTQDILALDNHARMNTPGTVGAPNWEWKLADFTLLKERMKLLADLTIQSHRK